MRGSMRSRVGGRGGRGARASPPGPRITSTKKKERRPDWRHDAVPRRSRHSLSPSRCRLSPGCGSTPIERRDYGLRHQDHEKHHEQRMHHPSSPVPPRSRAAAFGDLVEGYQSRAIHDSEIYHHDVAAPHSSSGLDVPGFPYHKSMFSENVPMRPFLLHPPDGSYPKDPFGMKSTEDYGVHAGNLTEGVRENESIGYRGYPSDPHVDGERENIYSRDKPFMMVPPSQRIPAFAGSSASFVNNEFVIMYQDHHHQPSDEFGRGTSSKLLENPLHRKVFSSADTLRQAPVSPPPARDEPWEYAYHDVGRRERTDHGYMASDNLRLKERLDYSVEYQDSLGSSFFDVAKDRVGEADVFRKTAHGSGLWDQRHALPRDVFPERRILKEAPEDLYDASGSRQYEFRMKVSRDHEPELFEENHGFGRDSGPMGYRGKVKSPLFSDHDINIYKHDTSPSQTNYYRDDLDVYEPSMERMIRRQYYSPEEGIIQGDSTRMLNDRNAFKRIQSPDGGDGVRVNGDRIRSAHSKRSAFGRSQNRTASHHMLASDDSLLSGESTRHREVGRVKTLKRWLQPGPSDIHGPISSERGHELLRPFKFSKRSIENRHGGGDPQTRDVSGDDNLLKKTEPPEKSEEFKQLVHKAFLRFTKMLNESPCHRKRYQEARKASNLLCYVCGSQSKYFADAHGLVSHAYHSLKVGLRTEHLGLHKALCLLMGWNWLMAPDNTRAYQSRLVDEAKALKEDLILWPPIIVIHNNPIGDKNNGTGQKIVAVERTKGVLKEMGFETGKIKVCCAKPTDDSIVLVKFMPTLSGLQEAERLHNHYADNKQGRQEFLDVSAKKTNGKSRGDDQLEKSEGRFHGYMAIAEDLDKLDQETKKRCLVKSKKEIKAIADAPLNAD